MEVAKRIVVYTEDTNKQQRYFGPIVTNNIFFWIKNALKCVWMIFLYLLLKSVKQLHAVDLNYIVQIYDI